MTSTIVGNTHRFKKNKGFESIPRELLQDTENLSFGAIGLLSYMLSKPETWTFHKTWLYSTPEIKDKRSAITKYWQELVDHKYIVQFQQRVGRRNEYQYYFNNEPFTDDEIAQLEEELGMASSIQLNQTPQRIKAPSSKHTSAKKSHMADKKDPDKENAYDPRQFVINSAEPTKTEIAKIQQNQTELQQAESWSKSDIDALPTNVKKELFAYLIRTKIIFDHNTFGTQLARFNEIYQTKGITQNRAVYYFLNGLKEFEDVAAKNLQKASQLRNAVK